MKENLVQAEVSSAEANVRFIKQTFAEFKKGNTQAVIDACTDDVIWKTYENPAIPFSGTFKGKEALKKYFKLLAENLTFINFDQKDFIGQGDHVVVLSHQTVTVKKTGKSIDQDICQVYRMKNGKIQSHFIFNDTRLADKAFT